MFAHAGDSDDEDEDRENLVSKKKHYEKSFLKVFSSRLERWRRRGRRRERGRS